MPSAERTCAVTWTGRVLAGLAVLALAPAARAQVGPGPGLILVWAPPDAEVEVGGARLPDDGGVRRFHTPPLRPGTSGGYPVRVTWRGRTVRREASVQPDDVTILDFRDELGYAPPPPAGPATPPPPRPGLAPAAAPAVAGAVQPAAQAAPAPLVLTAPFGPAPAAPPAPAAAPAPPAPPDRWLLMRAMQGTALGAGLDGERMQITGWADMSYTASSDEREQLPMGFNYRANRFLLQQNWLRIDRAVVTSGTTEPTFGFRSDSILPGSDYRFTLARGLFSGQLTADIGRPALYGVDPIQFYAEAYFPTVAQGLDVKLGRCFCIYGVETNDAVSNYLASHAYAFIYDPFTHTGVLANVKLNSEWSVTAGLMLGSDVFIDPADELTFTGGAKWTQTGGRNSVLASVIVGPGRFNQSRNFNNPEVFDVVYTYAASTRFAYNMEALFGFQNNVPDIGTAYWWSVLNYFTSAFTPRLSGTTRLELFDDAQGERTGFRGLYAALTTGLNFRPVRDVVFRPELRYDYNTESRPFEGKHGLFTAAGDVIVRW
jgi:hypothetical protein